MTPVSEAKCILVVEDEWLLASELSRRLRHAGYDVMGPVPATADAAELLDKAKPDAAVLDVQLDGEVSFSLAARLMEVSVPLLFLSGHSTGDFPRQLQGQTVLAKPADWDAVLRVLKEKLDMECA
jgi:DNA-binding response OmpR family regulator